ncbi:MAG: helix-turn-helix domain-containing protein [Reyranellales bacterium]
MIRAGALDDDSVEGLADRLGIGARHLDRLFAKHIGASPLQVARTTRLQKAKRLLDETRLPMSEVAARAGFASLRRFNSVFAEVYMRTPTQIRRVRFKPV